MRNFMKVLAASFVLAAAATAGAEDIVSGRIISLDVLIADVAAEALGDGEVTAAKVLELEGQGKLKANARLQISLLENSPGTIDFSESVPVVTGRRDTGGRGAGLTYTMQEQGTMIQTMARVEDDGSITLQLQAERTRLVENRAPEQDGEDAALAATRTAKAKVRTTTRLASGEPTIVGSHQSGVGKEAIHTYFVVTGRTAEGIGPAAAIIPERNLEVIALKHATAADIVNALRLMFEGQAVRFAADERSNSLVLHGPPKLLDVIKSLVAALDGE